MKGNIEIFREVPAFITDETEDLLKSCVNIPMRDLFTMWQRLHFQSKGHSGHPSWDLFNQYLFAEKAITFGMVDDLVIGDSVRQQVCELLSDVLDYKQPNEIAPFLGFWWNLEEDSDLIDRDRVKARWQAGINRIDDTFRYAKEQLMYWKATSEQSEKTKEVKKKVVVTARDLRNELPLLRSFHEKYYPPMVENDGIDILPRMDTDFPKYDDIYTASRFIRTVMSWGINNRDVKWLHSYFREALSAINIEETDPYAVSLLLRHVRNDKTISRKDRWKITNKTITRVENLRRYAVHGQDKVLEEAVNCFLTCDDFDMAINTFKKIEEVTTINSAITSLVSYALEHGIADKVRNLYPHYFAKHAREFHIIPDNEIISFIEHDWRRSWYLAVWLLAEDGKNFFSIPEIKWSIWQGDIDIFLEDLVKWSFTFPEDHVLRNMVNYRLSAKIQEYNIQQKTPQALYKPDSETGEPEYQFSTMSGHDVEKLIEALMLYKKLSQTIPQESVPKLHFSDISDQPLN